MNLISEELLEKCRTALDNLTVFSENQAKTAGPAAYTIHTIVTRKAYFNIAMTMEYSTYPNALVFTKTDNGTFRYFDTAQYIEPEDEIYERLDKVYLLAKNHLSVRVSDESIVSIRLVLLTEFNAK